jgi:hypothetical protein
MKSPTSKGEREAMRDEYAGLADVYDRIARDPGIRVFYREWRQALLAAANERGVLLD